MNKYSLENYSRPILQMPHGRKKLLLHSCCAPCAGEIMEAVAASEIDTSIFFYNPNIHPKEEYEIRKDENIRFAKKLGFDFIDADYDKDNWFDRVKGLENEPERGEDAQFALICVLREQHCMHMKISMMYLLQLLEYQDGKI